jgi:hypothetical protein
VCPSKGFGWHVGEIIIALLVCCATLAVIAVIFIAFLSSGVGTDVFVAGSSIVDYGKRQSENNTFKDIMIKIELIKSNIPKSNGFLFATCKLSLSFIQVMVGTLPRFSVEWGKPLSFVVASVGLSPIQYFPVLTGCYREGGLSLPFAHIMLVFFLPLAFGAVLLSFRKMIWLILERSHSTVVRDHSKTVSASLHSATMTAIVWFCIICFPFLASG